MSVACVYVRDVSFEGAVLVCLFARSRHGGQAEAKGQTKGQVEAGAVRRRRAAPQDGQGPTEIHMSVLAKETNEPKKPKTK